MSRSRPSYKSAPKKSTSHSSRGFKMMASAKKSASGKTIKKSASKPKAPSKKPDSKKTVATKVKTSKTSGLLKTASKVAGKVAQALKAKDSKPKLSKEQLKKAQQKLKQQEIKAKKIAAEKAKKEAKKKAEEAKKLAQAKKEAEKLKKLQEKEKAKALKEEQKRKEKELKALAKKKSKTSDEEETATAAKSTDEDDEFEEELKRSLKKSKTGKKAYEEEVSVDEAGFKKYSKDDLETKIADEIAGLREHFSWKEIADAINSMDFFNSDKSDECVEKGCDNIKTTQSYCRLHYLKNWKALQKKKEILKEGKLQEYIEELISKYPPKFIEAIIGDLSDDKEFYRVLAELNISTEFDYFEDDFEADADDDGDDDLGIETRFTGSMRYEDDT